MFTELMPNAHLERRRSAIASFYGEEARVTASDNYGKECAMQTQEAIRLFITSRQARGLRPKSLQYYQWCLGSLSALRELPTGPAQVEVIMAEAAQRLAPESCGDLWRGLRVFFRWLADRHQIPNPMERASAYGRPQFMVPPPRRERQLPRVLSASQVGQLLRRGCQGVRDRAMVLTLLDTGVRLAELAGMEKSHIATDTVRVRGKSGAREIPLSKEVLLLLLMVGDHAYPWVGQKGRRLTRYGVQHVLRSIFARAGLKGGPHVLRHTFATGYLRKGGNVFSLQRIMGHSDLKITQRYVHLVQSDLVAQHSFCSPALDWLPVVTEEYGQAVG